MGEARDGLRPGGQAVKGAHGGSQGLSHHPWSALSVWEVETIYLDWCIVLIVLLGHQMGF